MDENKSQLNDHVGRPCDLQMASPKAKSQTCAWQETFSHFPPKSPVVTSALVLFDLHFRPTPPQNLTFLPISMAVVPNGKRRQT